MTNVSPNEIRNEITPVTLQEPTPDEVIYRAREKGMTVGGSFPLDSETRYVVAFFDVAEGVTSEQLETAFESLDGINNAYYVGEHTTGINLPNHQWDVNLRIKIRETTKVII